MKPNLGPSSKYGHLNGERKLHTEAGPWQDVVVFVQMRRWALAGTAGSWASGQKCFNFRVLTSFACTLHTSLHLYGQIWSFTPLQYRINPDLHQSKLLNTDHHIRVNFGSS